jgi:hypothetical protein
MNRIDEIANRHTPIVDTRYNERLALREDVIAALTEFAAGEPAAVVVEDAIEQLVRLPNGTKLYAAPRVEPTNAAPQGKLTPSAETVENVVDQPAGAAPTPETDAPTPECDDWQLRYSRVRHWTDFARRLERERNEARLTIGTYQAELRAECQATEKAEAALALENQNHATDVALWEIDAAKLAALQKRLDDAGAELPTLAYIYTWPGRPCELHHERLSQSGIDARVAQGCTEIVLCNRTAAVAAISALIKDAEILSIDKGQLQESLASANAEIARLREALLIGKPTECVIRCPKCNTKETVEFKYAAIDAARGEK